MTRLVKILWITICWILCITSEGYSQAGKFYEPANQIKVTVTPTISFDSSSGHFSYSYTLVSGIESKQSIDYFFLALGEKAIDKYPWKATGIISIISPPGKIQWNGDFWYYTPLNIYCAGWSIVGSDILTHEQLQFPPEEAIRPGEKLSGLGIKAKNLPGIRPFWVTGYIAPPTQEEMINYLKATGKTRKDIPYSQPIHINALQGKTIGPDILPEEIAKDQLLDRIISLKEQAFELKWIDNRGVANSLNQKLDAAKKKIQAKEIKTAINILHAFIHELEAQRGKHIDDNAFYLLKPNAEYLIFKLQNP